MINISVRATTTGPFFDGTTRRHIHLAVDEIEEEIATIGADHLRGDLGRPPFINPTGWYKSHVTQKKMGPFWGIWDSGVIYGEWLAGTSRRNRTSRFKGYQHWRRAIAFVHRITRPTTDRIIARALKRG